MTNVYDFIIVGGEYISELSSNTCNKIMQERRTTFSASEQTDCRPYCWERLTFWETGGTHLDHGYKAVPQNEIGRRDIPYVRGKELGELNFNQNGRVGVWVEGGFQWMGEIGCRRCLELGTPFAGIQAVRPPQTWWSRWPNYCHPDKVYGWKIITIELQQNLESTSSLAQAFKQKWISQMVTYYYWYYSPSPIDVSFPKI